MEVSVEGEKHPRCIGVIRSIGQGGGETALVPRNMVSLYVNNILEVMDISLFICYVILMRCHKAFSRNRSGAWVDA